MIANFETSIRNILGNIPKGMRFNRVVRVSDCQCQSSILRHSRIWGAADEAVFNIVHLKSQKLLLFHIRRCCCWAYWPAAVWGSPTVYSRIRPPVWSSGNCQHLASFQIKENVHCKFAPVITKYHIWACITILLEHKHLILRSKWFQ